MNENIFRMLAGILLFTAVGISVYFRSKADRESGEKVSTRDEGRPMFLALRLGGLLIWFSPLAYLINPAWMAWSKLNLPVWTRWLGAGVGLVCIPLIYWLFSSIGRGITPTVATRKEHRLVTSGPYRWVRHPLYTIGASFFFALGVTADNWFIMTLAVIAFALLAVRTTSEEAHLIEKFGDEYRRYMLRTGRFLPKLAGPSAGDGQGIAL
jgi:protein-S-isoprenylcysteine O-methyltransferase Ste14